jgi:CspA family cold shock protein
MVTYEFLIGTIVIAYIAVCFARIASKHDKNPILYGILSVIPPINLIILGCWAFSDFSKEKSSPNEGDIQALDTRERGTVKWFNEKKGYGFIVRESGKDIFVHHSDIVGEGFKTLNEGDRVGFTVKEEQKGSAAKDVRKI